MHSLLPSFRLPSCSSCFASTSFRTFSLGELLLKEWDGNEVSPQFWGTTLLRCICVCRFLCLCLWVRLRASVSVCACVGVCACMRACVCVHKHASVFTSLYSRINVFMSAFCGCNSSYGGSAQRTAEFYLIWFAWSSGDIRSASALAILDKFFDDIQSSDRRWWPLLH